MSFVDLLRKSRSTPGAALHKFLTNYDPSQPRIYAFVEGDPDRAFYRAFIDPYLGTRSLYVYNCEGKKNVYGAYTRVVNRYPDCKNVLFFVDKDIDDIVGHSWPLDPRIFTTDLYAIESYLVCREAFQRYLSEHVKVKSITIDFEVLTPEFDKALAQFHHAILPIMVFVVALRRAGQKVLLSDIYLDALFVITASGAQPKRDESKMEYLSRVTKSVPPVKVWRQLRQVYRELEALDPKRYVRGKFEAWFFIEFIKKVLTDLSTVARESGGSISIKTPIHESNMAQLLARGSAVPLALRTFLDFHLKVPTVIPERMTPQRSSIRGKVLSWFRRRRERN